MHKKMKYNQVIRNELVKTEQDSSWVHSQFPEINKNA